MFVEAKSFVSSLACDPSSVDCSVFVIGVDAVDLCVGDCSMVLM